MLAALGALTFAVQGSVIFQDTFDTVDATDINTDYAVRQSEGVITASYTGNQTWYSISGNKLVQTGGGEIVQPANLAAYIAEGDFTLSFKQDSDLSGGNWASIYLASATEDTRANSRVGFHVWGTASATVYTLYSGTGAAGANYTGINITVTQMNTLWQSNFGTDFDRLAEHTIEFVSTAGTGGTNTYDFVVDGVLVYNDAVYAFNDDTVRNIEMVSVLPNDAADAYQVLYDDLTVNGLTPSLTNIRLIGISNSL